MAKPLFDQLLASAQQARAPFHTPGHKLGRAIATHLQQAWGSAIFQSDLPELPELDNLYAASGVLAESQAQAAEVFGADRSWFLVNGSTGGLLAAILTICSPDSDLTPIIPALESVLGDIMGEKVRDFNFKTITDRFSELMYDYPFRVPAKFALIIRSLVTQEGLALSVNPDFRIVDVAYPYIAKRLLQGESPQLRRRLLEVLVKDGKFRWNRLENLIAIAQNDGGFDLLPTAQMGLQYLFSDEGAYLRNQLLLALTENERLQTEPLQRLWELLRPELEPARVAGHAFNAFVAFSRDRAAAFFPTLALESNR